MLKQQIIDQNKQRLCEFIMNCKTPLISKPIAKSLSRDLVEQGVIAPPLMMAEVIYMIVDNDVVKYHITKIEQDNDYSFRFGAYPCENIKPFKKTKYFKESAIDKTVFQDYAEAVKKVKGEDYYE